jgi:tetratricopeptide (TPR) repeat protein
LQPDNLPAHVHLAHVLEQAGRVDEAIGVLRATLDRAPQAPDAIESLLALHERQTARGGAGVQRHLLDAEHFAEQVRRMLPHLEAPYYHLAWVRRAQGRAAEAVELARAGLQRDRRSFRSALLLGEVLGAQGLHEPAAAALEHALAVRDVAMHASELQRLERAFARSLGALGRDARLREVQRVLAAELAQSSR